MSGLGVDGFGQAHAQSVFRCGSSYSNEANCEHGTAASLPLQGDTPHASKTPVGMAQQMQSEADRLEKIRQRETRLADQQVDKHSVKTPHAANKTVAQKSPNDLPDQHKTKKRKKSKANSTYFTAKGAADSKKP
jgi:hypothetical protein